jgi:DNA-binding beta-propeller fold protein YncE
MTTLIHFSEERTVDLFRDVGSARQIVLFCMAVLVAQTLVCAHFALANCRRHRLKPVLLDRMSSFLGRTGMRRWKFCSIMVLALALGTLGCHGGGSSASTIALQISPTAVSVITNTTQQFSSLVTGTTDTAVTWTVTCPTGVTAPACGTIDSSSGLYTAPKTIPTNGSTTITPTATITGAAHADTSKTARATVTIISGIRITITPATATIGTGETFTFVANVSNPGCDQSVTGNTCLNVTWSAGAGSIDANGVYTAPSPAPSPSSVTITAKSVADTAITATASVTVTTATDPTLTSVSPKTVALGSLFQDIYITGTNFISTNNVFVNGAKIDPLLVADVSSSVIRARILDATLAVPPPSGVLQVSVSRQKGTPQDCTPDVTQCQIVVTAVRPAVVGPSPDSIPQGTASLTFNVNGGFFGTSGNPAVSATYDGQPRTAQISPSPNSTRQLSVIIGGVLNPDDFDISGLHQVAISSKTDPSKFATTNIAVQPDFASNPPTLVTTSPSPLPVGTGPSDVAINPATGMAVVANTGSNDVTLIDMTASSPAVTAASICTAAVGAGAPCPSSGPKGVAVAHVGITNQNIALVANSASKTIAEIDLDTRAVTWVSPPLQDSPVAVGINPVTGRALVAMNTKNYGLLVDLTQTSPVILGAVSISTGTNPHIAVEPHLNWAIATPGGAGSLSMVDLNRQTTNNIVSVSRSAGAVTVTVQASTTSVPQSPLAVQLGDAVQIQGVSDNSFNGIYTVTSVGPGNSQFVYSQVNAPIPPDKTLTTTGTVNYAAPIATLAPNTILTQGIAINPETQQAILLDPNPNAPTSGVLIFSLLDQSISSVALTLTNSARETGAAAGAFNPLTNTAYIVNSTNNSLSIIDPAKLKRLPTVTTVFPTGRDPVAVAVDPASNRVIVVNQTDNNVSIFSLGGSSSIQQVAITETSPKTFVTNSTLSTAPAPAAQILTVIGKGFTSSSQVRLDGIALPTSLVNPASDRQLVATVPPLLLMNARRFAVDVQNPTGPPSNASDFTVIQSVDVSGCSATPNPAGVAIDPELNIAVVSLSGCNTAALINLSNGTGQAVTVGANPLGVAVIPRLHKAVVANNGSSNASIVDELGATVTSSPPTGSSPMGVAVDQDTGEAAVANSGANTVTVLNVSTGGTSSISTSSRPIAVAFNYQNHQIAVASSGSNSVGVTSGSGSTITSSFNVSLPTSLLYDPSPYDCGTSNTAGCFLATSSTGNVVDVLDPITQQQFAFRVGINPTAIAYNYLTSTLISTNTGSHTVTVVDFLDRRIRAVLSLPAPPPNSTVALTGALQFAVDIHPLTNLAVIADTANGRVLFVPVPR